MTSSSKRSTTIRSEANSPRSPARIGILNDYVRIPHANGSSFASQFLYREFCKRGHRVTVIGPEDPLARAIDLPDRSISFKSLPLRFHPGVYLAFPNRAALERLRDAKLDVVLGQTGSAMMEAGVWLRATARVPFVSVNTIHLPSVVNVVVPEAIFTPKVRDLLQSHIVPWLEQNMVSAYNQGDGLVVLSEGLHRYWRERGVTVPISIIPRAVDPTIFDAPPGADPFPPGAKRGSRLLTVCRMSREKGVARMLQIFARNIAPRHADATLTLVGDGPDQEVFAELARTLGVANRVFFVGEQPLHAIPRYLRDADLFMYTSLSETYGQVISEAQWCGLAVIAFADDMGVSQQIQHGRTGILVDPSGAPEITNFCFASAALRLLRHVSERDALRLRGQADAHARARPEHCVERYYETFALAREHCRSSVRPARPHALQALSVARWTSLHMAIAGAGLLRPPATVNRHNCQQPVWERRGSTPARSSSPLSAASAADA